MNMKHFLVLSVAVAAFFFVSDRMPALKNIYN